MAIDPSKAINLDSNRTATERDATADLIGAPAGAVVCYGGPYTGLLINCPTTGTNGQAVFAWRRIFRTSDSRYIVELFVGTGAVWGPGGACEEFAASAQLISIIMRDAGAAEDTPLSQTHDFAAGSASNPLFPLCAGGTWPPDYSDPNLHPTLHTDNSSRYLLSAGFVPVELHVVQPPGGEFWGPLALPFFDDVTE